MDILEINGDYDDNDERLVVLLVLLGNSVLNENDYNHGRK